MAQALILCRFIQFASAMLMWGIGVFRFGLASADLRIWPDWPGRVWSGLVGLNVASTVIWLTLEAGEAGDGWVDTINPDTVWALLGETAFGHVWLMRLALAAAMIGALVMNRPVMLSVLAAGNLASLALVGHAAMHEGWIGLVQRANQMVHLLAAGFWIGGLPALLSCLAALARPNQRQQAARALARFSGYGHLAVALVLLSGVVNVGLILGVGLPDLSSPYQRWLAAKIGLVALMVAIALCNRYVFVPRMSRGNGRAAVRAIALATVAEIVLGAAVLAMVSAFATFDPV